MFIMSWREAARRGWGLSIVWKRRRLERQGKWQSHHAATCTQVGLFCSVRELVSSTLLLLSCIIILTTGVASGLRMSDFYKNLSQKCILRIVAVSKSSTNIWTASCLGLTAHAWALATECLSVPDGHQQASPMESLPTSLGIKAVPAGRARSLSLALGIHWCEQLRLWQWT